MTPATFAASAAQTGPPRPRRVLTRFERQVIVEALAEALVEDFRAGSVAPGDSPAGIVREMQPCG